MGKKLKVIASATGLDANRVIITKLANMCKQGNDWDISYQNKKRFV